VAPTSKAPVLRCGGSGTLCVMTKKSVKQEDQVSLDEDRAESRRDHDPVASLRDTEAEAGDEDELTDRFDLDSTEARDLGVALDRTDGETPFLD
jgi:hypothetical protein